MKKTLALALAVVFVLAFAAPVFAQNMTHSAEYKMVGDIDLEKQVGHLCNTGAEMKQTIKGEGDMTKTMDVAMVKGKLTVDDKNDWVTAPDAVVPLTVTSVIELCAPPKQEYTVVDWVYYEEMGLWVRHPNRTGVVSPIQYYETGIRLPSDFPAPPPYFFSGNRIPDHGPAAGVFLAPGWEAGGWTTQRGGGLVGLLLGVPMYTYGSGNGFGFDTHLGVPGESYTVIDVEDLTTQIWAVQVQADPGFSGNLHQKFEAAYGPYEGWLADGPAPAFMAPEGVDVHESGWGFRSDDDFYVRVESGDDYVGNYFHISQMARTSMGTTKRFIDISSPWSGAYLMEDMTVVGMTEIKEAFAMNNLAPGAAAVAEWWELF